MWDIKHQLLVNCLGKALVGKKKILTGIKELYFYWKTHFSASQMYLPKICLTKSKASEVSFLTTGLGFSYWVTLYLLLLPKDPGTQTEPVWRYVPLVHIDYLSRSRGKQKETLISVHFAPFGTTSWEDTIKSNQTKSKKHTNKTKQSKTKHGRLKASKIRPGAYQEGMWW